MSLPPTTGSESAGSRLPTGLREGSVSPGLLARLAPGARPEPDFASKRVATTVSQIWSSS